MKQSLFLCVIFLCTAQAIARYEPCKYNAAYGKNRSWQVQGYYGVMGGEAPHSYGYQQAGAYSFSMGFRRFPN